jgi:nucleotide-binding universal stress UspA family protein
VLRDMYGPVLLLGPHADAEVFHVDGPMIVCSDGSAVADAVLPIAAQWAITLPLEPWVVTVSDPNPPLAPAEIRSDVVTDITHAAQLAHKLTHDIGRTAQHEALHNSHVPAAIAEFASDMNASLIVMSTHGATGLRRVALGSVTMAVVHRTPCPVLVYRPAHLEDKD